MTLFESQVEWLTDDLDDMDEIKSAIWDDEEFKNLVSERGLEESLLAVSHFHKMITSQLAAKGVTGPDGTDWARKTIGLAIRAKSRRQQLRRAIQSAFEDGADIVARIRDKVEQDWAD